MKIRAFVLPDGSVVSRYADVLVSSAKLKPEQVRRVTNVEWSENLKMWCAYTLTGKAIIAANSRRICLEMEGEFVDKLLSQFFQCRRADGQMLCPECEHGLGDLVYLTCPYCGKEFPNIHQELRWGDFELQHLVCL